MYSHNSNVVVLLTAVFGYIDILTQDGLRAGNASDLQEFISNNFVRLNVVLGPLTATSQTDRPTQQLVPVLAQWCGALGFWLGLSAMTVAEIFELIITLIRSTIRK